LKFIPQNFEQCIQPQPELYEVLRKLKERGKFMFLSTNRSLTFTRMCLEISFGEYWGEVFDLILAGNKKPLWASYNNPFLEVDPLSVEENGTKHRTG
jgi:FMN phosphatase YigB (HAD superfamily)